MWGFSPDVHGYVGFTNPGPRERYIQLCQPGDLMLVIGQNGETADPRDVGRMLGLVELIPEPRDERECMSAEAYREKVARFGAARWRYAMPVKRAWKITREVKARTIAPITCAARNARALGASFMPLTEAETTALLALPSRPMRVWGQADWATEEETFRDETLAKGIRRGPKPAFGNISQERKDGETYVYIMTLSGSLGGLFTHVDLTSSLVLKVGMSNDVRRREDELNWGFPPGCGLRWKIYSSQRFGEAQQAFDAETELLTYLEKTGYLLSGTEFAIVPKKKLDDLITLVGRRSAFLIKGAPQTKPRAA